MLFLIHLILGTIYLFAIVAACNFFTNAIEHLGAKLKLDSNAIGSILAVIGTTLPETIVPIVAIIAGYIQGTKISVNESIATGAILGSPFILTTLALFLLGIVLIMKKRQYLNIDHTNVLRDFKYFIPIYIIAILTSFAPYKSIKYAVVLFLIIFYIVFVKRTITRSKQDFIPQELDELFFFKFFKKDLIFPQIIISIFALILFSHLFIEEINYFSQLLSINPLVLSLFITPVATELPECVNSIIWLKNDKDDLAIANVLGAIVFQAVVPMSIGILFTPWKFDLLIMANIIAVVISSIIFTGFILLYKKVKTIPLLICGAFYFLYLLFVIVNFFS